MKREHLGGIKDIVEKFHEHPAITPERYAYRLRVSWTSDESKTIFRFLLTQADQGDLENARQRKTYEEDQEFRDEIDKTMKIAPSVGMRHGRFLERTKLVIKALEEEGFESIKRDWEKWKNRKDLFDYVVTKSV